MAGRPSFLSVQPRLQRAGLVAVSQFKFEAAKPVVVGWAELLRA